MRKSISVVTLLFLFLIRPGAGYGERMVYTEAEEPSSLNPLYVLDSSTARICGLLYDRLIGVDINMIPQPVLLKSFEPETSSDSMSYTFKLKPGIVWHDKEPFTAKDVEFTTRMLLSHKTITNLGTIRKDISSVKVIDDHTITFYLRRPLPKPAFLGKLNFPIVPYHKFPKKEYLTPYDFDHEEKVIGTGPYEFKERREEGTIFLNQNKKYFKPWRKLQEDKEELPIDKIAMKRVRDQAAAKDALITGGVHLIPLVRPVDYNEIRSNPYCELVGYRSRGFAYFGYNCKHPFLKDAKVRQALTHAIDRKAMLENIFGEEFANPQQIISGPFPPGEGDPDIQPRDFSLEKAKELLKEAGFSDKDGNGILEKDGNEFIVSLKAYAREQYTRRICVTFQAQLDKLGIKLKNEQIDFMERNKWFKEVIDERDFDIVYDYVVFGEDTDIVDELFSMTSMAPGGGNFISYTNTELEKLLAINRETFDPEVKKKNLFRMHSILHEEAPYTFLFSLPNYAGVRNSILKGVEIHPYYFFTYITNWYMKEGL